MVELSIILPCAVDDGIRRCLDSIDEDVEVMAVLNGATHEAESAVMGAEVQVVRLTDRNLGLACNQGVLAASHDLVLLMNSDCVFEPGAIRTLAEAWRPGTVVSGMVRYEGTGLASRLVDTLQRLQSTDPPRAYQPALLFHRSILNSVGYFFDEDIHWTEDADFTRRVRAAEIPIRYVPEAVVWHARPTLRSNLRSAFRYGIGRRIAEEKALLGTKPHFRLTWALLCGDFRSNRARGDTLTACYGAVWLAAFALGHRWQRHHDVYGARPQGVGHGDPGGP